MEICTISINNCIRFFCFQKENVHYFKCLTFLRKKESVYLNYLDADIFRKKAIEIEWFIDVNNSRFLWGESVLVEWDKGELEIWL